MILFDSLIVIEKQLSYTKKVLSTRKEHFQESFEYPLFNNEKSAAEVFIHGITPLYQYCHKILDGKIDESEPNLELNAKFDLPEQYLDLYERTFLLLKAVQQQLTEKDLNQFVDVFNSQTQMRLREWLSLNIMHTVTHIGQALRLQSLYLRNKLEKAG